MLQSSASTIVIVGGGFAGAALAYQLLMRGGEDVSITIIERRADIGLGHAYSVNSPVFKLNVPAARMSIDPDRPDDFREFSGAAADAFVPRAIYGEYVVDRLARAVRDRPGTLQFVRGEAVAIDARGVRLADGRLVSAQRVVLATGVAPRISQRLPDDPRIVDAWNESALAALPGHGRVLVLGSGLTALDAIVYLHAHGQRGEIVVLSRHGLWPRPHARVAGPERPLPQLTEAPTELRALLRWGRQLLRACEPWQRGMDALRPHTSAIWQRLSPRDRARFARSVRPYWEVLRHRAPHEALAVLAQLRESGQLSQHLGELAACEPRAEHCEVTLRVRGAGEVRERFQAIVRCTGPALALADADSPLMAALLRSGLAQPDASGLGLCMTSDAQLVDAGGAPSQRLYALGQPCRAARWETTAVPDISRDAAALARVLLRS